MVTYDLYALTSDGAANALESNGSQLNLAVGVKIAPALSTSKPSTSKVLTLSEINFHVVEFQFGHADRSVTEATKSIDLRWTDEFAIKAGPASKSKQSRSASVDYVPNCAINAFEFRIAVEAQAKLSKMINGDWTEIFKVGFSNSDGSASPELVLYYTNQLSQIVSYSESRWTLVGLSAYTVGAIFGMSITDQGYVVTQETKTPTLLMPPMDGVDERLAISWSFGPLKVEGYIDTEKLKIGVVVYVLGVSLGQFYGNLTEGLVIKLNLFIIQGEIKLYLQGSAKGKEVWIKVKVNVLGICLIDLDQMVVAI